MIDPEHSSPSNAVYDDPILIILRTRIANLVPKLAHLAAPDKILYTLLLEGSRGRVFIALQT